MPKSLPIVRQMFRAAGGAKKVSKALKISRQAIYAWKRVPGDYVIKLEKITGIPRERIRPDLYV